MKTDTFKLVSFKKVSFCKQIKMSSLKNKPSLLIVFFIFQLKLLSANELKEEQYSVDAMHKRDMQRAQSQMCNNDKIKKCEKDNQVVANKIDKTSKDNFDNVDSIDEVFQSCAGDQYKQGESWGCNAATALDNAIKKSVKLFF